MKKFFIVFSVIFGILFACALTFCIIAYNWAPEDFGQTLLIKYEELSGDYSLTVPELWIKIAWATLWSSIVLGVLFLANLLAAIFYNPEKEKVIVIHHNRGKKEDRGEKVAIKEAKSEKKEKKRYSIRVEPVDKNTDIDQIAINNFLEKHKTRR